MWWFAARVAAGATVRLAFMGYRASKTVWWLAKRNVRTYTSRPQNAQDWTWVLIEALPWYLYGRKHKDDFANALIASAEPGIGPNQGVLFR